MNTLDKIAPAIFGVAVGDALGVPVEFKSREQLTKNPVTDMREFGTHHQPKGTWSDDSSLAFCLMESLSKGYNLEDMSIRFLKWMNEAYWTPHGSVFDIGMTTRFAMLEIAKGTPPEVCGGFEENNNGNGSLMRILPLAFHLFSEPNIHERYMKVKHVSSITHGHFRSVFSCFFYIEYAIHLIKGSDKFEALELTRNAVKAYAQNKEFNPKELQLFNLVLNENIAETPASEIRGSGYVLSSLEASLWAFISTKNYKDAVLKVINLGEDTDTTGAITGGLAGLYYGFGDHFDYWRFQVARYDDIEDLIERFRQSLLTNESNEKTT
jgi:ADP-ribosyl-[dinitrogen reductase] hydrolase